MWERYLDMTLYPEIQFYDYTKWDPSTRRISSNYHLTFSRSEHEKPETMFRMLARGFNVAVVFDKLWDTYHGREVIDGDKTDLRFLDPTGVIVGLTAKGDAKKDESGFVIHQEVL
jgi:hypothetical protein